ncbi:MAG TPA: hypothetical protein VK595_05580 [Vicinamibacterales bacterium]|nr:hypothetical protein [Vicinamibacterales bacterium]
MTERYAEHSASSDREAFRIRWERANSPHAVARRPGRSDAAIVGNTDADQQLRFRGSLDPGRYAFYVRADAGAGNLTFTFDMAPVARAASPYLVGSGVLGLLGLARGLKQATTRVQAFTAD